MKPKAMIPIFLVLLITGCSHQSAFLSAEKEGWFRDHTGWIKYCRVVKDGGAECVYPKKVQY